MHVRFMHPPTPSAATYHASIQQADLNNDLGNRAAAQIMGTLTRLGAPHPDNLAGLD